MIKKTTWYSTDAVFLFGTIALTRYFIIKSGSFYTNWDNLDIFADWSYGRQEKNRYKIGAEARI